MGVKFKAFLGLVAAARAASLPGVVVRSLAGGAANSLHRFQRRGLQRQLRCCAVLQGSNQMSLFWGKAIMDRVMWGKVVGGPALFLLLPQCSLPQDLLVAHFMFVWGQSGGGPWLVLLLAGLLHSGFGAVGGAPLHCCVLG